jgi:hypothetical protein
MVKPETKIKLTIEFRLLNIDKSNLQEASKFILRFMRYIPKNKQNIFEYRSLLDFMKKAKDDEFYYRGSASLKEHNIERYWYYSKSEKHSVRIENFNNYYVYV